MNIVYRCLYKDNDIQYSKKIIGEIKDIKNFSRKKLLNFIREKYYKNKFYLTIYGKFNEKDIKEYLEKILKKPLTSYIPLCKKIETELKIPFFSSNHKPTIEFFKKPGHNQNLTFMVFRFTDFYNKNIDTMNLLLKILGYSHSSFLFELLREKNGLTYSQSCHSYYFQNHGFIYIRFESDIKNTKKIIELIWNSLKKLRIKKDELKTAKEIYRNNYNMEKENFLDWVNEIEENWILEKEIPTLKNIDKISLEDIQNLFKKVFIKENLNIYSIGDYKKIPSIKII